MSFAAARLFAAEEMGNVSTASMSTSPDRHQPAPAASLPSLPILAAGGILAAVLALSIAAQTYLSMLGHGHSFSRMLAWQLITWSFWACAAPFVLRHGAQLMARRPRTFRDVLRIVSLGALLFGLHTVVAAQLTMWLQPFVPVETYDFFSAWARQLPALFVIDLLAYGLLVVLGGALWTYRRAQQLEVQESRLETELARAEVHALRLEIEPHFLFNTLNAITALVRLNDNRRAVDMLVDLGDFMRSNLDRPHDQFVPLATEIAWVKRYVGLQHARFGDRLDVDYQIPDDCLEHMVPTLLLQPIVENAFRHGLSRQAQRGRLDVTAARQPDALIVTIADDGVGVPPDFDVDRQVGPGLRNVRARLAHLYGGSAFFEIRRAADAGTIVTVRVPLHSDREVRATA
jgi:two-component system LytT family sensor kinase